jgi:hypothetical protein
VVRHLIAVAGASIAWFVLAATLDDRTQKTTSSVTGQVDALWGSPITQNPPAFFLDRTYASKSHAKPEVVTTSLDLTRTRLAVTLALDERRKGLLWFSTYAVDFAGTYDVAPVAAPTIRLDFPLPAGGIYDDVSVSVDGHPLATVVENGELIATLPAAGRPERVRIAYHSHGLGSWIYAFGNGVSSVRDFDLAMHVNFGAIDFPPSTLAPTAENRVGDGWNLDWRYSNLISANAVGMLLPEHLQPGPIAERITLWAPVSLLFYVFVLLVVTQLRRIDLHPVNYFFLAAAFFAFHLLFAYLVDRIAIELAFVICSLVSMFLTISYLRLVVGLRFAAVEAGLAQFFYLILFSLALFNEGSSGLSITIGAILTLFVTMQATGRVKWSERTKPATPAAES